MCTGLSVRKSLVGTRCRLLKIFDRFTLRAIPNGGGETSPFVTFEHDKVSCFMTVLLTEIADMSRFMPRFVILSNSKNSNIFNPTVFAGGANSRRWGRAGPGRPRPGHVIFSNHGPKTDLVCDIPIPRDVGPARPARF